ncbi:hypothetical protein SAPIO_CDS2225 [Scedosporium apiospermum]|uniref:Uncharacterized protein n=1 Tax=Pseudallescheria apiosperma TaxID=563466 RepID=A0A084GDH8_PSEDA|nr:uncharacterized protein SAPIO_CDS2225 [Scedosporium apiospermum]KEZ45390.1 hypothetical protein SAPIO_CDS2225 [Scedosporium apiospermum]
MGVSPPAAVKQKILGIARNMKVDPDVGGTARGEEARPSQASVYVPFETPGGQPQLALTGRSREPGNWTPCHIPVRFTRSYMHRELRKVVLSLVLPSDSSQYPFRLLPTDYFLAL